MHPTTNMLNGLHKRSSCKEQSKAYVGIVMKSGTKDTIAKRKFSLLDLHLLTLHKMMEMKMIAMYHLEEIDLEDKVILKGTGMMFS